MVTYWSNILLQDDHRLTRLVYDIMFNKYTVSVKRKQYVWLNHIKSVLISCGIPHVWQNQQFKSSIWLKHFVKQHLKDLFVNRWNSSLETSSSCRMYRLLKSSFDFEPYLMKLPATVTKFMIKLRTRNHRLPIEKGRWNKIPLEERTCHLCNSDLGDEYHYILVCKEFSTEREQYLKPYYFRGPNIIKFKQLLTSTLNKGRQYNNLCKFVKIILTAVT